MSLARRAYEPAQPRRRSVSARVRVRDCTGVIWRMVSDEYRYRMRWR